MRDLNGTTIHIKAYVTLTKEVRPRRLIGRQGVVISLGDVRVHVQLLPRNAASAEDVRIEPNKLLVGKYKIYDPMFTDPLFAIQVKDIMMQYVESILTQGVEQNIITEMQLEQLMKLIPEQE